MYKMQIKTEYRDDEIYGGVFYLTIEADVFFLSDPHTPDIDLVSVKLNGRAGLILSDIPTDIKDIIEEQVLNEYERHIRESTKRKRPGTATRHNGGGSPEIGDAVQHSPARMGV